MSQFEKEEDALCEAYNRGEISTRQFDDAMRELRRDIQARAEEAAREAYDREMSRY